MSGFCLCSNAEERVVKVQSAKDFSAKRVVHVGELSFEIEVKSLKQDSGIFSYQGKLFSFFFLRKEKKIQLWLRGKIYTFEILESSARQLDSIVSPFSTGDITAPMPGRILKIYVDKGERVGADQPLVVMESMKMEMTLSAPFAGIVREIPCRVDELVEMGQTLLKLEKHDKQIHA